MRFRTVLFDVGGTLIRPCVSFGAVYARVLGPMGVDLPAEALETAMRSVWREMDGRIPPGVDRYGLFEGGERGYWLAFLRSTLDHAGEGRFRGLADSALDALREAFADEAAWTVYPDVQPALEALRADGAHLGVVSNWDSRLIPLLSRLDLLPYFQAIIVSSAEGFEKPSPTLFLRALERLGAEAGSALHVGDVPELDLEGARAAGIAGVLVDRDGRLDRSLGALRGLGEVVDLVEGRAGTPAGGRPG